MKGLYLEELPIGETFALGSHHFTTEEFTQFAYPKSLLGFCGWMATYVAFNAEARAQRLATEGHEPAFGPSPGVQDLQLGVAIKPGDVVHYSSTPIHARAFNSKPGWGIVESENQGVNDKGEMVVRFKAKVLIATKP